MTFCLHLFYTVVRATYAYKNFQFMWTYVHIYIYVCWLLWLKFKVYKFFSFKQWKSLTTSTWTPEDTMETKLQGTRSLVQETYKIFIFKSWINCLLTEKLSFQIQWILQSMNLSRSNLNSGLVGCALPLLLLMRNHGVSHWLGLLGCKLCGFLLINFIWFVNVLPCKVLAVPPNA